MGSLWFSDEVSCRWTHRPELETYKYDMPGEDHVTQNELFLFDIETLEGTVIDEGEDAWTDQTYSIPTVSVTRHSLRLHVRRFCGTREQDALRGAGASVPLPCGLGQALHPQVAQAGLR